MYRKKLFAYEATGCPDDKKIEKIDDRIDTWNGKVGPCVNIDTALIGVPGSDLNAGRIMSVKFEDYY